jgi:hypothetical protein
MFDAYVMSVCSWSSLSVGEFAGRLRAPSFGISIPLSSTLRFYSAAIILDFPFNYYFRMGAVPCRNRLQQCPDL